MPWLVTDETAPFPTDSMSSHSPDGGAALPALGASPCSTPGAGQHVGSWRRTDLGHVVTPTTESAQRAALATLMRQLQSQRMRRQRCRVRVLANNRQSIELSRQARRRTPAHRRRTRSRGEHVGATGGWRGYGRIWKRPYVCIGYPIARACSRNTCCCRRC